MNLFKVYTSEKDAARTPEASRKMFSLFSAFLRGGYLKANTSATGEKAKYKAPVISDFEILKPISRGAFG